MPKSKEQSHPHRRTGNPCRIQEKAIPHVYREEVIPHVYRKEVIPPVYREEAIPPEYKKTVKLDLKRRDN